MGVSRISARSDQESGWAHREAWWLLQSPLAWIRDASFCLSVPFKSKSEAFRKPIVTLIDLLEILMELQRSLGPIRSRKLLKRLCPTATRCRLPRQVPTSKSQHSPALHKPKQGVLVSTQRGPCDGCNRTAWPLITATLPTHPAPTDISAPVADKDDHNRSN